MDYFMLKFFICKFINIINAEFKNIIFYLQLLRYSFIKNHIGLFMQNNQYYLDVKDNETLTEEGHFFKAARFQINVNQTVYDIEFKEKNHHVYYFVMNQKQELTKLTHPDYVPDCSFDDLNHVLSHHDAQTIFAALCHCGVSIKKEYLAWLDENAETLFSYKIIQPNFL